MFAQACSLYWVWITQNDSPPMALKGEKGGKEGNMEDLVQQDFSQWSREVSRGEGEKGGREGNMKDIVQQDFSQPKHKLICSSLLM